jgi:hypothetical protein
VDSSPSSVITMLKLIGLSTALSAVAIIVSLPQTVFSRPEPQASSVRRNVEAGSPFCYMRTQRGVTLNLENLCRADDGSSNGNRAANVPNNPAATNPNQAAANQGTANGAARNGPAVITINAPAGAITPAGTNTGTNGNAAGTNSNANGTSNAANTGTNGNAGGTNSNANGTSNAANTGTNGNLGGASTSTNGTSNGASTATSSNFNGTNPSTNVTSNGTNTGTSRNFGGTNRNVLQP